MKKRTLAITLAITLAAALTACGRPADTTEDVLPKTTVEESVETTTEAATDTAENTEESATEVATEVATEQSEETAQEDVETADTKEAEVYDPVESIYELLDSVGIAADAENWAANYEKIWTRWIATVGSKNDNAENWTEENWLELREEILKEYASEENTATEPVNDPDAAPDFSNMNAGDNLDARTTAPAEQPAQVASSETNGSGVYWSQVEIIDSVDPDGEPDLSGIQSWDTVDMLASTGGSANTNPAPAPAPMEQPAAPAAPAAPAPEPVAEPVTPVIPAEPAVHTHDWQPVNEQVWVEPYEEVVAEYEVTEMEMVHICYCDVCGWESPTGQVDLNHVEHCYKWIETERGTEMYMAMLTKDEMRPVTRIAQDIVYHGGGWETRQTGWQCSCGATKGMDE